MRLFSSVRSANDWHKTFIILPRRIVNLDVKAERRVVISCWYFLCFVERRFSVTKGVYTGVEYRTIAKHEHQRCAVNCGMPGCEAPIGTNLSNLRKMIK